MLDPVVRAAARPSRAILSAPARRYRLSETGNVTANAVLNYGKTLGTFLRGEVEHDELQNLMAGGQELVELESSFERQSVRRPAAAGCGSSGRLVAPQAATRRLTPLKHGRHSTPTVKPQIGLFPLVTASRKISLKNSLASPTRL
jgi:hypothetical protein